MKKLVNVVEVDGEGLSMLMGERVTLFCIKDYLIELFEYALSRKLDNDT